MHINAYKCPIICLSSGNFCRHNFDRVLAEAAKGWFMTDRRDKKEGDLVPPYDAHGLDLVRAYQIVCFMVGSNEDKFKHLADETNLPKDRQDSCALAACRT